MTISSLPELELAEIRPEIMTTIHIYVCGLCLGEFPTIPLWRAHMFDVHKVSRANIRRRPMPIINPRRSSANQNGNPIYVNHSENRNGVSVPNFPSSSRSAPSGASSSNANRQSSEIRGSGSSNPEQSNDTLTSGPSTSRASSSREMRAAESNPSTNTSSSSSERSSSSWLVTLARSAQPSSSSSSSNSSLPPKKSPDKNKTTKETKILNPKEYNEVSPVSYKHFAHLLRKNFQEKCNISKNCPHKFENSQKRSLHENLHSNEDEQKFKCSECSLEFDSWRRCSLHVWRAHKTDVDLLKCPVCLFKSHSPVVIWRHMRFHQKWRPYVLRSLQALFKKPNKNLKEETTRKESALKRKRNNRYYSEKICDICNRKFANGKTLSKHVKTVHNKIKPFICNVCGMKTARKASLAIHMRQHTGEKPLKCKTCKFATRDPSVLHKHQMRHAKFEKFKCPSCDYTCIQTNAYKRHLRQNHPIEYEKVACKLCNFVTISAEKLTAHVEDHSRGLINNPEDSTDAATSSGFKGPGNANEKNNQDSFHPAESIDSMPHEPTVDTGGVTIPAPPSEETQFPFNISQ